MRHTCPSQRCYLQHLWHVTDRRRVVAETAKPSNGKTRYDRRYGETDLLEGELHRRSEVYLFGGLLVLLALACVGAVAFVGVRWLFPGAAPTPTDTPPATVTTCR